MYKLFSKILIVTITLFFIGFLLFKYLAIGKKAGELAASSSADVIIFAGDEMKVAYDKIRSSVSVKKVYHYAGRSDDSMKEIAEKISSSVPEKSIVLIKGSRGMGLERITKILEGGEL